MSDHQATDFKYVGKSVPRVEDAQLLVGRAQHIGDLSFPGMLHVAFLRSAHAHARIKSINLAAALNVPGVEAALTGSDMEYLTLALPTLPGIDPGWSGYSLAVGKVRYVGEPVVGIAASSRAVAEDATELVEVDYEVLDPVVDPASCVSGEAALLFEEKGTNVLLNRVYRYGEPDERMATAEIVVRGQYQFPRVSGNPMETFGVMSRWDTFADEVTCWSNAQSPTGLARFRAFLRSPPAKEHVISQPHGGSFGTKLYLLKYLLVTALLSRRCGGRHVKYIEDRIEHLMASGTHAWDRFYEAESGFMKDGRCVAMKVKALSDVGASAENNAPSMSWKPMVVLNGPYDVKNLQYELTVVVTNKSPEGAYRGYGIGPHTLVTEWLMDKAAAVLGMDPAEIRRRNFIQPDAFPYTTPMGTQYDSGNYPEVLRVALEESNYLGLREEQKRLRAEGRLVGISVVFGLEPGGVWAMTGPFKEWFGGQGFILPESATIGIDPDGRIDVELYYALEGQGQYTFASQIVAEFFGVLLEHVYVRQSDSHDRPPTMGPAGSRQAVALSSALMGAANLLGTKLKRAAAVVMQTGTEHLEIRDGRVAVKGNTSASMSIKDVAALISARPDLLPADLDGNPQARFTWRADQEIDGAKGPYLTYANACHVVMVEIEKSTGRPTILKYQVADDCGTRINPAVVEGQVQGGLAQGVGAALLEEYLFDDQGQPLSTTFADYLMPSVYEVPMAKKKAVVTPSPLTPFGVKGTGEGAIHVTPAAIFCAINDALAPLGVELEHGNAKPERLWQLIQQADRR